MSVLTSANYIKEIWHYPCYPLGPLTVVKAGLAAGSLAMMEFFSWGCRDFLKARLGRAQPCGRFFSAAMQGPPKSANIMDKANRLYSFLGPVDKLLYAALIADIGSTFLARWHSFAYAMQGCIPSEQSGTYNYHLSGPFGLHAGDEGEIPWQLDPDQPIGPGAGMDAPSNWYSSIYFTIRCHPLFSNGVADYNTRITQHGSGAAYDYPADPHKSWHAGRSLSAHGSYSMQNQRGGVVLYRPTVIANEDLICDQGTAVFSTSPLPLLGTTIKPLSCFKHDLTDYFPDIFNQG